MTVAELRAAIKKFPPTAEVQVWLPGTYIRLGRPIVKSKFGRPLETDGKVLIEGEVEIGDLDY